MRKQNIICLSWIPWDFLPLVMHHMMKRLAKENRILWVDPPAGLATPFRYPKYAGEVLSKVGRWVRGVREEQENLWVYAPPPQLMTFGHNDAVDRLNRYVTDRAVGRLAHKLGFDSPILWIYDPHAVEPRGQFGEKLVCFDSNDDIAAMAGSARKAEKMRAADTELARSADIVFVTSKELYRRKDGLNPNLHYAPSGIDFEVFNRAAQPECEVAPELRDLPRPVIGYVGNASNYRIEWDYIRATAQAYPEASIVFIGPVEEKPPPGVGDAPNVHFLGRKPQEQLAEFLKGFDVGIIPFTGGFMKASQPTKTFEYLAAGMMVVATAIPELKEAPEYHGVVKVADNQEEFVRMVGEAVEEVQAPGQVERCIDAARTQTWEARVELTTRVIDDMLAAKSAGGSAKAASVPAGVA